MSSSETRPTVDDVLTTLNTYIQKLDTHNTNQNRTVEKLEERIEQTHILIRQNEKRINKLDTRIVKLDTLIESIDKTLIRLQEGQKELRNHVDDKFDTIMQRADDRFDTIIQRTDDKFDKIAQHIFWTVTGGVGVLTIVLGTVTIALKVL